LFLTATYLLFSPKITTSLPSGSIRDMQQRSMEKVEGMMEKLKLTTTEQKGIKIGQAGRVS
jgi:hypothetical protein